MSQIFYSLKSIHQVIEKENPSQVCIVTSDILKKKLAWAIKEIGVSKSHIISVVNGEAVKEWNEIEKLLQKFVELNLDRKSLIIALGGGTIGDSVGFAASIYLRGIKYIQVPTTLLAQVDSSHGGKTGINFLGNKNQVGSFYPPLATIIDTRFIGSLSKEQITEGLGEIIKAGCIREPLILSFLKKETLATLPHSKRLEGIIKKSIKVKEYYIKKDYKDNGLRQILNVGHTLGHALELKYKIGHGKAVLIGMLQEFEITERMGLTHRSVRKNLVLLLKSLGIEVDTSLKPDWKNIVRDKKVNKGSVVLPAVAREGRSSLIEIKLKDFREFIVFDSHMSIK